MRRSRFQNTSPLGPMFRPKVRLLRLVSFLIRSNFSAKAFDIIISSQPLSTNVLQKKLPLGLTIFPLYTNRACLFAGLLLYGENVQILTVFFCLLGIFSLIIFCLLFFVFFIFFCFCIFYFFSFFVFFLFYPLRLIIQATVFVPISNDGSFSFLVFFSGISFARQPYFLHLKHLFSAFNFAFSLSISLPNL